MTTVLEVAQFAPAPAARWSGRPSTLGYYAFMALGGVVGLMKGVAYAKILGSEGLGFYALVVLIAAYAEYACHLGLYPGLECILPPLYGAGRTEEAENLRNMVAGYVVLLIAGLGVVALVGVTFVPAAQAALRPVLLLSVPLIAASILLALVIQDLRSRSRPLIFATVLFGRALLTFTAGVLAAHMYGYTGALIAEIIVVFALFAVTRRAACEHFRLQLGDWRRLRPVMAVGIPLGLKNITNQLALTMDRWCVVSALGLVAFSQYTFALILVSVGLTVHATIWVHFGPRRAHAFGQNGDLRKLCRSLRRLCLTIVLLFVLAAVPFGYLVDLVVPRYFAEYEEGARLLPIIYWGVCGQMVTLYEWVPMVLKRTGALLAVTVVCTAVTAALYALGMALGWSLIGFAWVFVFGRLLMAAGYLGTAEVLTARRASLMRGGEVA